MRKLPKGVRFSDLDDKSRDSLIDSILRHHHKSFIYRDNELVDFDMLDERIMYLNEQIERFKGKVTENFNLEVYKQLIRIRILFEENSTKAKQLLTNLIKKLEIERGLI